MCQLARLTDEELMARAMGRGSGADYALAALWNGCDGDPRRIGYNARLLGLLRRMFPMIPEADREDLVLEVLRKLLEQRDPVNRRYDSTRPFRPWLFEVAINLAKDFVRSAEFRRTRRGFDGDDGTRLDPADKESNLAPFAADSAALALIAIDTLPDDQREPLILRLAGISNNDVAAILGLSPGEASKRTKSGLNKVKNIMNEQGEEHSNPMAEEFFRQLQSRNERDLDAAVVRMRRLELVLNRDGQLVGFTAAAHRADLDYISDHLRGVLPVYLLRHGVETSHANAVYAFVVERLRPDLAPTGQPFRAILAGLLTEYCGAHGLSPSRCRNTAEFLRRLLMMEKDGPAWVAPMKVHLAGGTIQEVDDLVNPLQWPVTLWPPDKDTPFKRRMSQLHASLTAVLRNETEVLGKIPVVTHDPIPL